MAKVMESLIAKGRRARRAREQKEVAFGLAELSTKEELLERLVSKGGIKSLLLLLTHSKDNDAQRFAALALANAVYSEYARDRIANKVHDQVDSDEKEERVIKVLCDYIRDREGSDIIGKQYCAMAIGNIAASPDLHSNIVNHKGIEALLSLLKDSEDIEAGRYAAFALTNLCSGDETYRRRIVELGGLAPLVTLACSEEVNAQKQAIVALRALCLTPEFRVAAVRDGALDPLVLAARSDHVEVLREVAATLLALSTIEENKMEVADRALGTIVMLMLGGDVQVEWDSVAAAANLMEMPELHGRMLEEKGITPLVALAGNEDLGCRGEAARCLANLSVNADTHQAVVSEHALAPIVASLSIRDENCLRFAALTLANLSTTVAMQVKVVNAGAIKPLIELAENPKGPIEGRRYAVLALVNLTSTTSNHLTIIRDGGLNALFSLCNSPDLMSRYYIGCALANLATSPANHHVVVEHGGLQAIVTLINSSDADVQQQAAAAIRGLSVTHANKMKIVQEGALEPLSILLLSDDVDILREACGCMANLALSDENKLEMVKAGVIPPLITQTQAQDMQVASQACAALANLAQVSSNQEVIANNGAVRPTITAMRSKFIEVQREAGRLLGNLCASESETTNQILQTGGHNLLISYLLSQDTVCQRVGSMGICNLCTQPRYRRVLMECGVLEPLCSLARTDEIDLEIQRYAVLAIANLASAHENHRLFIEEGMMPLLISLSSINDPEVRQYAAYALVKIAQNAEVRQIVTDEGGLEPVLYLARTEEPEIQREVLPALCNLSFVDANKIAICRHGGLDPIVRAIRDGNLMVSRLACTATANLGEIAENMDLIVDATAIPGLVSVLPSVSEEVRREAARALGVLAGNIEFGDMILREGALPHLIPMLRAADPLTQRMGAMAVCNLSCNSRNHGFMLDCGLFKPLLDEAKLALDPKSKSDFECTRYCLLTLANLSVNMENHNLIMTDALEALAGFSKHRDIKCRQYAIFSLANLCSNINNVDNIVSSGCLRTIITYAFPSSDVSANVQFQATSALRGLATHPQLRVHVVREGAMEPLILSTHSESIEVKREAAAALCNLSMADENKVIMARGGALPVLINLVTAGDLVCELHATQALANIAEMVEGKTQERMLDEGVLRPLLLLSDSSDNQVRREAARALALFAAKKESHEALIKYHIAGRIALFLKDDEVICQRFSALAIGNFAISRESHSELFAVGAVPALIPCAESQDLLTRRGVAFAFAHICDNNDNFLQLESLGVISALVKLIKDEDKDVQLQAVLALRHLFQSPESRNQFLECRGLKGLLQLGSSEEVEVRREVAAALRNLSSSEFSKIAIVQEGGVAVLVEMLHSPDVEICHQSIGVVANISESAENQGVLVEGGILQHIKYVMTRSKSIDIQREATRALANLAAEYTYAPVLVESGALLPLVGALSSADFLSQRYAIIGVSNLATNAANQRRIMQDGALDPIISLARLENGDVECQRYATFGLTNLSATRANHAAMRDAGTISLMRQLIDHTDVEIRNSAALAAANFSSNGLNHPLLMENGFLPALIALLSNSDRIAQLRAVSALRGLSTDADIRLKAVDLNVIPPLLTLAKCDDVEIQMESLGCLCNMSLCGCIGDNPLSFLEAVDVQHLVAFLCSADATYRLFGALTLGNIASSVKLQEDVMKGGALTPLVTIASTSDIETQRAIAYALCNLAADPARRPEIVREGGLPALFSMACAEEPGDQRAALSTLRGICSQSENRREMMRLNIREAIGKGAVAQDDSILLETACILCYLSINDDNKLDIAADTGLLSNLKTLLDSRDVMCVRHAMGCLANVSERLETHHLLLQNSMHMVVSSNWQLADVDADDGVLRELSRFLVNLTSVHQQHEVIIGCSLLAFATCCRRTDALTARFATLGLLNLCTNPLNHKIIFSDKTDPCTNLITLSGGCLHRWNLLDFLGNSFSLDTSYGTSPQDTQVVTEERLFIEQFGYDGHSRRYAVLALGNLALSPFTHKRLIESSCLSALKSALQSADQETRLNAAFTIAKLTKSHDNHSPVGEFGIIPPLIDLLTTGWPEAIANAVCSLRHLSHLSKNRFLMLQSKALVPLSQVAHNTTDLETLRELVCCACNLTLSNDLRIPIANSPLLVPLMALCNKEDVEISRIACGAAANLAECRRVHEILVNEGNLMHSMVFLMRSKHVSVQREATRCISNTLSSPIYHKLFIDDGGLPSLFRLCRSHDLETLINCVLILRKLSPIMANHEHIIKRGGLQPLQLLTSSPHLEVNRVAVAALRDMTTNAAIKVTMAEEGVLVRHMELCSHADLEVRVFAIGGLRHLTMNARIRRAFVEQGGVKALFSGVDDSSQDLDLLRQCAATIGNLAESVENHPVMLREGVSSRLVHLSAVQHPEVQAESAKCFASLSSNTENQSGVFGKEQLQSMISLVNSIEEGCRRDALIALGNLAIDSSNQSLIVEIGGLPIICRALSSEFESCLRHASRTVYRLSSHPNIQPLVVDVGAVPYLNTLCQSKSRPVRKFAVMTLCNLSMHPQNQIRLLPLGCGPPLIRLLDPNVSDQDEWDCAKYSVMAISNLSSETRNQFFLPKYGCVSFLVKLALIAMKSTEHNVEMATYSGMALANVAVHRQNRVTIVQNGGLEPLVLMSRYQHSVHVQRSASQALYNISGNADNHIPMIKAEVVPALAVLGKVNDVECRRFGIMTLANLSANSDTRQGATRGGGLHTAVILVQDIDLDVRRYAAIALANMANAPATQEQVVVHGALPYLLQLAHQQQDDVVGTSEEGLPLNMVVDGVDIDAKKQALMALSNVAINEVNHSTFIEKGILKVLRDAFETDNADLKEVAAFVLSNMCSNPDYIRIIGQQGGIPPLIRLSQGKNVHSVTLALASLRRLADAPENWPLLVEHGILTVLACGGTSAELEIQREVAAAVCSLSLSEPHRVQTTFTCIRSIIKLSASGDLEVAQQAVGALANLAEDQDTHEYIAVAGGGKCLVSLEVHNSIMIHREATRGIANLLSSIRHQNTIIEEGLPGLVRLAFSTDEDCSYQSALCLRKLTPNVKSHPGIVEAGGFKALFHLVQPANVLNKQRQAAAALRDLCADPEYKVRCYQDGGGPALIQLARQPDEQLQALALAGLRHLSTDDALKGPLVADRVIKPTLRCISGSKNEDIHLQCAGLLANLTERPENQNVMVEEGVVAGLVALARNPWGNEEIRQDAARALANLSTSEDSHSTLYRQGALDALLALTTSEVDITQRYAAMGIRFLSSDPEVRVLVVEDEKLEQVIRMSFSKLLEYRRAGASAFSSFTLHPNNRTRIVRQNAIQALLSLAADDDLATKRDAVFSLANLSDSPELQGDLVREGILVVLAAVGKHEDARVQRDAARAFSTLSATEDIKAELITQDALPAVLFLAKSLDVACQRYAALALCNLCCGIPEHKTRLIEDGALRPLVFLARFPDTEIQRYAALALAGLALGHDENKQRLVRDGAIRPLVDLLRFPDREVQLTATIAMNAVVLGNDVDAGTGTGISTKATVLSEGGCEPLVQLGSHSDTELVRSAVYALGTLSEDVRVLTELVALGAVITIVRQLGVVRPGAFLNTPSVQNQNDSSAEPSTGQDLEVRRACAYFLATASEREELLEELYQAGAFEAIISLAASDDIECQEYSAFALSHIASSRIFQVRLVDLGAVRPLVAMMSSNTEPRHYAGLALLKLADNFENHIRIAEEGGIQALLRCSRSKGTDDQLQYKASLTVGHLASYAVRGIPTTSSGIALGDSEHGNSGSRRNRGDKGKSGKATDRTT